MRRLKYELIRYLTLLIILSLASYRFYLSYYLPNMGDAALHAWVIEEITKKEELIFTVPNILTNFPNGFPLQYPVFFHLTFSIGDIIIGGYKFLPPVFGVLSVLLIYLIGKDAFKSEVVGLFSAFFVAIHPYYILFTSTVFMESLIVFEILAVVWLYLRYIGTSDKRYLILTVIFLGISIGTKQIGYILVAIILLFHFIVFRKNKYKISIFLLFGSILIGFPMLLSFYRSFGTLLFPMRGDIDKLLFSNSEWTTDPLFDKIGESLSYSHLKRYLDPNDILNFYDPSAYYLTSAQFNKMIFVFMIIIGIISCLYMIYKSKNRSYYGKRIGFIIMVLICYHVALILLRQPRYFIHSMLLVLPIFIYPIVFLKNRIMVGRNVIVVLITTLIIFGSIMFTEGIIFNTNWINTQGWMPSKGNMHDEIEAFEFINSHISKNERVLDFHLYHALYYLNDKDIVTVTAFGGMDVYSAIFSNDPIQLESILVKYNIKYFVIREKYIVERDPLTLMEIPIDVYNSLISSGLFKPAFSRPGIIVWEFTGDNK
ncbi:MAG: glycosyltransferase family 39 protein [Candidatus Methanoperedens sp.]|nr:glycosyltransferase family 39 protein [Candidatus Methanoperedens sp.]